MNRFIQSPSRFLLDTSEGSKHVSNDDGVFDILFAHFQRTYEYYTLFL